MQAAQAVSLSLFSFWGKADHGLPGSTYHLLPFHSLDVAACGVVLLERCPLLRSRLERACDLAGQDLRGWLLFLLATHDIGKFADGFQSLRSDLMDRLQGTSRCPGYPERHDTLGYRLWVELLSPALVDRPGFWAPENDDWRLDVLPAWLQPICGHHGRPPKWVNPGCDLRRQFPSLVREAAERLVTDLAVIFLPDGLPASVFEGHDDEIRRASWLVAGWATAADWIGSNVDWFPYESQPIPLPEYWCSVALPRAEHAVAASGMIEVAAAVPPGLSAMFTHVSRPTPLQALAESLPLPGEPQLLVLEEVTGGGKTEAALVLAHRLMANGLAAGLYFALPTMATANAMHRRLQAVFHQLFEPDGTPSLVLAHSRQRLYFALERSRPGLGDSEAEPTASQDCSRWLSDSRKKALLAQVGVGTIDQALLAVLPVRHQSLRVLGLAPKVLIVDEVHACDAYVLRLLARLLELHAALGGSALLLSATLAADQRQELAAAFARGRGYGAPSAAGSAYPLLTHLAAGRLEEHPVAARPEMSRRVEVRFHRSAEAVLDSLAQHLDAGACACWVRNTVGDALEGFDAARARFGEARVRLFHSRFTVFDRRRIEDEVLSAFGPESGPAERRGRLLVATQVVEQSLDLDFDFLVTDLAPVDLLIQRAGRLRRHRRSLAGGRQEDEERGPVGLEVLAPEPGAEPGERWFAEMFPRGAFVYEDHGRLWLGAKWLEEHSGFSLPEDAREMIEHVYAREAPIPAALAARSRRAEGESLADKALAHQNALRLEAGYQATAIDWPDDALTPTRLGETTVMLCLLREEAGRLLPWHKGEPYAWEQSEVQVRQSLVSDEDPAEAERFAALRLERPGLDYLKLVVLHSGASVSWGRATNLRGEIVSLSYDPSQGLSISTDEVTS